MGPYLLLPECPEKGVSKGYPKWVVFGPLKSSILDPFWDIFWSENMVKNVLKCKSTYPRIKDL